MAFVSQSFFSAGKQKTPASLTGTSKALEIAFIDKRDADMFPISQSLHELPSRMFDQSIARQKMFFGKKKL